MTFNRHTGWLYATFVLLAPGCDLDKSLGSVDDDDAADDTGTVCTLDARVCPDGTEVGREGPDCEFAPCPGEEEDTGGWECTGEAKICPDGSAVGRQGPDCEFAPCPGEDTGDPACPEDGKICPDGTTVVRGGPDCEFAPCPGDDPGCTLDAKICPDGTAVGRTGPNCEFAPCPGDTCSDADCGPAPGAPSYECDDGTLGGPICLPDEAGECGWTIRECPVACTADAKICHDGSSVGRMGPDCEFAPCPGECDPTACEGDPPDAPVDLCADGTPAGAFCLEDDDGTCSWMIQACEPACDLDAYECPDGTVVGREGPNCEFAPCPTTCEEGAQPMSPAGCPSAERPVLASAGCYTPCDTEGEACGNGNVCMWVQTNPCECAPDAEGCCAACAADTLLCMPAETDSACGRLIGHTFRSADEHECGETPDGLAYCNWQISFTADGFEWHHSDVVESSDYECEDGTVSTTSGYGGTYDPQTGILVWNDVEYEISL